MSRRPECRSDRFGRGRQGGAQRVREFEGDGGTAPAADGIAVGKGRGDVHRPGDRTGRDCQGRRA